MPGACGRIPRPWTKPATFWRNGWPCAIQVCAGVGRVARYSRRPASGSIGGAGRRRRKVGAPAPIQPFLRYPHPSGAHGVAPETAVLPAGWRDRLVPVRNENTRGCTGWCLKLHDSATSKLVAEREKDMELLRGMLEEGLLEQTTLEKDSKRWLSRTIGKKRRRRRGAKEFFSAADRPHARQAKPRFSRRPLRFGRALAGWRVLWIGRDSTRFDHSRRNCAPIGWSYPRAGHPPFQCSGVDGLPGCMKVGAVRNYP